METKDLRKAGLKVTLPRLKILEIFENNPDEHLSAEDVYRHLMEEGDEKIGLATVYRVLTQFESAGLIARHNFDGGQAVFELEQGKHHDHIVCVHCGKVVEFVDKTIEDRQKAIAEENGFILTDHSLVMYGNCQGKDCAGHSK
ncbi:Fur family ferric uptake regulator [Oceanococcus atlanticus]|uniref:Ferric uptake regulation protein n=1 Tax=Oceanococcus atlanticus TaxID=1317117 RepID=A0A1Y1SBP9_9GAMM|nr:ferric iron uptake transcriptional regulator [Oceanococcus atlanticus]ORE86049.1 Fur family ferric uptake regulator [Oceanococcus atlanticus]RZO86137.1 MAG: ferric iron uptake transcriptional regulator [Oceanococcus sp.]